MGGTDSVLSQSENCCRKILFSAILTKENLRLALARKPGFHAGYGQTLQPRLRPRYCEPIPTLWTVWKSFPSVRMLGAMMISVS